MTAGFLALDPNPGDVTPSQVEPLAEMQSNFPFQIALLLLTLFVLFIVLSSSVSS